MRDIDPIDFHYTPDAKLTVGQLRAALAGIPDDFPVLVVSPEEPGGDLDQSEQIIVAASRPEYTDDNGTTGLCDYLLIEVDFAEGDYVEPRHPADAVAKQLRELKNHH